MTNDTQVSATINNSKYSTQNASDKILSELFRSDGAIHPKEFAEKVLLELLRSQVISAEDVKAAAHHVKRSMKSGNGNVNGGDHKDETRSGESGSQNAKNDQDVIDDKSNNENDSKHSSETNADEDKSKHENGMTETTNTTPAMSSSPKNYRTRHVALQFSYDGTEYSGFAQNVGSPQDNSIEKALFAALEKSRLILVDIPRERRAGKKSDTASDTASGAISNTTSDTVNGTLNSMISGDSNNNSKQEQMAVRSSCNYSRCGRTDKGVHAHGQVVALHLKSAFPPLARHAISNEHNNDAIRDAANITPGEFLTEECLPKNSLDGMTCLVPPKCKPKKRMSKATKPMSTNDAVVNLDVSSSRLVPKTIFEYDYPRILNNLLPPTIRVLGWCPVSSSFSARFSCYRRTYRYFFPRRHLDLDQMAQGLECMMGRRDFRNLCKMNCEQVYNFERFLARGKVVSPQMIWEVSSKEEGNSHQRGDINPKTDVDPASLVKIPTNPTSPPSARDICHIEIQGQAFLWHQIRCIMSILFMLGRNLESPTTIRQLLDVTNHPAKPSYEMASHTGLVLHECSFHNLGLGRTVQNLWEVNKCLERRWEAHSVSAERARNAILDLGNEMVRWNDVVNFVQQIAKERRKKEQKIMKRSATGKGSNEAHDANVARTPNEIELRQSMERHEPHSPALCWSKAIAIIETVLGVHPYPPNGTNDGGKGHTESTVHVPLMERSKGTTYEQKVQAILGSNDKNNGHGCGGNGKNNDNRNTSKRRERYEENIIKKRKTTTEDKAFYDHMLKQGGSSL